VRDSKSGDLIIKLVNGGNAPKPLHIELKGVPSLPKNATKTVLTGANPDVVNPDGGVPAVKPEVSPIKAGKEFDCEAPANSLTVIRLKCR
jgi:alpha-L-arabinofuranosidase